MKNTSDKSGPIGIFDSGYGGLTVFKEIVAQLPQYDYVYLGDNARIPYGIRSFETVYQYTWECVQHLFRMGCRLVVLACNTASAKALRTIQQIDLVKIKELHRVLGVIRPTAEVVGDYTLSGHVGIMGTKGTIGSKSYELEIKRFFPDVEVHQQACPMWVPLVESNEQDSDGADFFVDKYIKNLLNQSAEIDTIILACTHYPLLIDKIKSSLPAHINLLSQGKIVANSLHNYLHRHPEIELLCSKGGKAMFYTTESTDDFDEKSAIFLQKQVFSNHLKL